MMNKVMLVGRLVRDADLRYTQTGTAVANVSLAVNRRKKEGEEEVAFIDVAVWGEDAERFTKHHKKGDMTYVEGRIVMDSWEDKDSGARRTKLKVHCEKWKFMSEITGGGGKKREDDTNGREMTGAPVDNRPF